ncbi:MAG: diguanylate cyclase, partial [Chlorobiales bacterium]|nr:diguanylate cyclase [Chlorobiales bacterium]
RLKSNPATADIPVIIITARDRISDETKGLSAGAVDYISKPFSTEIVRARVQTHLNLKWHMDRLAGLAAIDELTGLPNRRRFNRRLEEEWARATRTGSPLALVMMDVDHFKFYNDHYGHGAGDECLRRVARALDNVVQRTADMVARYGGEEFAAILPFTNDAQGLVLGNRFCRAVSSLGVEHAASPVRECVTLSAGVAACIPAAGESPQALVDAADLMLYKAKGDGRNRAAGAGA